MPPTDIALAQLAPGRPPGEKVVIVRVERAADVDEPARQDALEDFSFLGALSDQRRDCALWGARRVRCARY